MKKIIFFNLLIVTVMTLNVNAQNNPRNLEVPWKTDKSKKVVPLDEFTILLMPDGIPPIDDPVFMDQEQAMQAFFAHEPVIALELNNEAKAYPLSILMFHEIVNDQLGGIPIAATYCPLCNAAIVFDRRLNYEGEDYLLDFGVSGMLRKSDLVMWDRQTESWWQQFTGEALVGKLSGAELDIIPSMLISLEEFFDSYPDGKILSTETGHFREYGSNPYTQYDASDNQPRFFKDEIDDRLPAMERVIDIHVDGKYKVYPLSAIQKEKVINDEFQGEPVVLFFTTKTVSVMDAADIKESRQIGSVTVFSPVVDGKTLTFEKKKKGFVDKESRSVWSVTGRCISGKHEGKELQPVRHGNHFAFAWFAFHPDTEIYGQ
jgi:hypothetical protein